MQEYDNETSNYLHSDEEDSSVEWKNNINFNVNERVQHFSPWLNNNEVKMDDYELNSVGNLTEDELMHMFSQPLNSEYRNAEENPLNNNYFIQNPTNFVFPQPNLLNNNTVIPNNTNKNNNNSINSFNQNSFLFPNPIQQSSSQILNSNSFNLTLANNVNNNLNNKVNMEKNQNNKFSLSPTNNNVKVDNLPSSKIIEECTQISKQIYSKIEKMQWNLKELSIPSIHKEILLSIEREQREIRESIDWADKQLNHLLNNTLLESHEMHQLIQLQQDLFILMKQLEIYIQEVQGYIKDFFVPTYALVIVSQPFPDSVKQHKNLEESVTVRLLTPAKYDMKPRCIIKAEVITTNSKTSNKKHAIGVENNEKFINEAGLAIFNDLKFPNGTRLKSIRLKFTSKFEINDARGSIHSIQIESNATGHIVVKTNENQWFEAEGILLKKTAFGGQNEISWCRFCNWLQRRYLGATRQNLPNPIRPLTSYDLQYIHKLKFENKNIITQKDFDKFWEWFGPLLHKIRYQRHICSLWIRGYICGFLTREEVDTILKNEQAGTFLIRFAGQADQFALSYQSVDQFGNTKVKHYLVKADDTHGKKTLPDFLRDHRDFSCLLQLWTDKTTQKRILRRCDKEAALKEFYSKRSNTSHNGYEETINVINDS